MAGKSLTVDLSNGKVRLADVPEMRTRYKDAFGVAGLAKLVDSYALVLLTGGEAVCSFISLRTSLGIPSICPTSPHVEHRQPDC